MKSAPNAVYENPATDLQVLKEREEYGIRDRMYQKLVLDPKVWVRINDLARILGLPETELNSIATRYSSTFKRAYSKHGIKVALHETLGGPDIPPFDYVTPPSGVKSTLFNLARSLADKPDRPWVSEDEISKHGKLRELPVSLFEIDSTNKRFRVKPGAEGQLCRDFKSAATKILALRSRRS